jgi:hypothetical protein
MNRRWVLRVVLLALLSVPEAAFADAALLLEEPYGPFGSMNPTGHAAVYLTRICADAPHVLRRCDPGEVGVVISRYRHVGGFDWLAVPLVPYLYAVDRAEDVPAFADSHAVAGMRDDYRRAHLRELVPDAVAASSPRGDWIQLMGAAYDRRISAFSIRTTVEQDDELIRALNTHPNTARFNLFFRNCADFSRDVFNLYFPKALRSSAIADLGLTTPKQIAKSLVKYSRSREDLMLSSFVVPQIPGNRSGSRHARGVLESLLKTKKYVIPLAVIQPWIPPSLAAGYFMTGRFDPKRYQGSTYSPFEVERHARRASLEP